MKYIARISCNVRETEKRREYMIGFQVGVLRMILVLDNNQVLQLLSMIFGARHDMAVEVYTVSSQLIPVSKTKVIILDEQFLKLEEVSNLEA